MHIAFVISSLETGGAERVLSELANCWASRGHKASLITLSAPGTPSLYPLDPRVCLVQLNQLAAVDSNVNILVRLKNIAKRIFRLRKALKVAKPDVIISFVDVMNITTILASRGLEIPVIVSERTHPAYYQLPAFYKKMRRMAYPWADRVICQTVSALAYFSWLPDAQKQIIPNWVRKAVLQKKESDILTPVRRIVSVGRLCKNKGFHTLILAFSELVLENRNLELIIYGEGTGRPGLENLIQRLHLTNHVFLPGTVRDINGVLHQADLFVFPSRYEGFPNALCEAMAVGLPIIASNCSGTTDIVRDGIDGRLFPVGDVNRLTALLRELIEDPDQRAKLSQGARAISDRFSQASVLRLWDDVLAQVAARWED